jgi:hypothetical protein
MGIKIRQLGSTILGYIYVYIWVKRTNVRRLLEKQAVGVLAVFLVLLLVEVVLEFYGKQMASGRLILYGKEIATSSGILKTTFAAFFVVAMYSKYREWRENRQGFFFIESAKRIAHLLSRPQEEVLRDETIVQLLGIFHKNFETKGSLNVTVALKGADDQLTIKYRFPTQEPRSTSFAVREGGAGYSYANGCIVYIPRKGLGHAIIQTLQDDYPYEMVESLYKPSPQEDKDYVAILSVPLVIFGTCYGALNFDSAKPNAFRCMDFQQAAFYASVVAQILRLREESPDEVLTKS